MSPVARSIRKEFEWFKKNVRREGDTVCNSAPFSPFEMDYLFPEMLEAQCHQINGCGVAYPCWYWDEETILRIMAEVGILD